MIFLLFLIFFFCAFGIPADAAPMEKVLYTYDLTYTLKLNRDDPVQRRKIWDDAHFVTSLQGIVNRSKPRLYVYFVGDENGKIDRYWLDRLRERGEWLADYRVEELHDIDALVRRFRRDIKGLVVYDEKVPSTSNAASTVAGVENLACVRYDADPHSLYHWLTKDPKGPRLPVKVWLINKDGLSMFTGKGIISGTKTPSTGSRKCDPYIWAKVKYLDTGKCNPRVMGYYMDAYWLHNPDGYIPNHTISNQDYFISKKGFIFDLSPWDDETPIDDPDQPKGADFNTLKAILQSAWKQTNGRSMIHIGGFLPWDKKYTNQPGAGGKHTPVAGEWRYGEILSCYNAYMDSDALGFSAMANSSVYCHYPLKPVYPQKLPTVDDLKVKGYILPDGQVAPKKFVTFYIGDYDAAAWVYQLIPQNWDDPARGKVPLGWAFNPNLADRFPVGFAYTRKTATPNDYFVAGDSGAGYLNPSYLVEPRPWSGFPSGLDVWRDHCSKYYKQWDISLTGFIIDGNAPPMPDSVKDVYADFSPKGIVCLKSDRMGVYKGMPFMRMTNLFIGNGDEAKRAILKDAEDRTPDFLIYRNVFWRASSQKEVIDLVKSQPEAKDIEFVDPYTLMLLIKQFYAVGQQAEINTDLWDVKSGAEVTGSSEVMDGFDPRDMFGGEFGKAEGEKVVFQDGRTEPFAHWVEWRTPAPVKIDRYRIYAHGDGSDERYREFKTFRLYAKSADGGWTIIDSYTPSHPYMWESGPPVNLLCTRKLEHPVTSQSFRAEIDQYDTLEQHGGGPRIMEIDGFGDLDH